VNTWVPQPDEWVKVKRFGILGRVVLTDPRKKFAHMIPFGADKAESYWFDEIRKATEAEVAEAVLKRIQGPGKIYPGPGEPGNPTDLAIALVLDNHYVRRYR
jgi:hypothetical protein